MKSQKQVLLQVTSALQEMQIGQFYFIFPRDM